MMSVRYLLFLIAILAPLKSAGEAKFDHAGNITMDATTTHGVKVRVTVNQAHVPNLDPLDDVVYLRSVGALHGLDTPPAPVVRYVKVDWGKMPSFLLNKSAFADLYDVRSVQLTFTSSDQGKLQLVGGDGSTGYRAEIIFAAHGAVSRTVTSLAHEYSETTHYRYSKKRRQRSLEWSESGKIRQ
jgi:hypothetical protein